MFVLMLTEEPPPPPPEPPPLEPEPFIFLTGFFFLSMALLISGIVAWKYKAILEFIVIVCTTIAGFIIGFMVLTNMAFAMFSAVAALLLSIAAVALVRILKKPETTTN